LDFSPCSSFLLLGFSYTQDDGLDSKKYPVAHVYRTVDCQRLLQHLSSDEKDNCSNGARFLVGSRSTSFVYGTVGGRVVLVGDVGMDQDGGDGERVEEIEEISAGAESDVSMGEAE
jgi:hypothetical protein